MRNILPILDDDVDSPTYGPLVGYDTIAFEVLGVTPKDPARALEDYGPTVATSGPRRREPCHRGMCRNLSVTVYGDPPSTFIVGSIARFYYGDNSRLVGPADVERAVEAVAENVGLPLDQVAIGPVRRVDVAADVVTDRPSSDYVVSMAHAPRMHRNLVSGTSVQFNQKSRELQLAAYDKGAERGTGSGPLRLEARFRSNLAKRFGRSVQVSDLWDPRVFDRFVDEWSQRFNTVVFADAPLFPADATPRTIGRYMMRWALAEGVAGWVFDRIDANVATHPDLGPKATKQRAWLKELLADEQFEDVKGMDAEFARVVGEIAARTMSRSESETSHDRPP